MRALHKSKFEGKKDADNSDKGYQNEEGKGRFEFV